MTIFFMLLCYAQEGDLPVRIYELEDWITYKNCNHVTSFTEANEFIYFGTSGGIVPYQRYQRYWGEPYTVSNGLGDDQISAVFYDRSTGYLWASHREGISFLNPTEERWENSAQKSFPVDVLEVVRLGKKNASILASTVSGSVLSIDQHLGFYQGTYNDESNSISWSPSRLDPVPNIEHFTINEPYRIDPGGEVYDDFFREYSINLFNVDENLDIYGGIWELGILTGDYNIKRLRVHSFGPLENSISAVELMRDKIICGSLHSGAADRAGLSIRHTDNGEWTYCEDRFINELASPNIFDLQEDRNGRIWIGTDQGLSIYDFPRDRWQRISGAQGLQDEYIQTICIDDTLAWIGTPLGLNKIHIPTMIVKRVYLTRDKQHMKILKIIADGKFLWIGTENGLYRVDKLSHNVEHYDMNGTLLDIDQPVASSISAIAAGDSLTIFAQYNGLLAYNHTTKNFTLLPDLIDAQIVDMDSDDRYLWLGTDDGAYLMRLSDHYVEHYTTLDGLPDQRVNRVVINDSLVWFGTGQGLCRYKWRKYAD